MYLSLFHTTLVFFGRESFLSVLNTGRSIFALLLYSVGLAVSGDVIIKFILPLMCMQFLKYLASDTLNTIHCLLICEFKVLAAVSL